MCASFACRVGRDRKGRNDRTAHCQNWQDINSENAMNEIEAIETSVELVDGRQKVTLRLYCTFLYARASHH